MRYLMVIAAVLFVLINPAKIFSQDNDSEQGTSKDSIEVFLIDSYITPEQPYRFVLSFFTSKRAKSSVVLQNKYTYIVSDSLTENHKKEIDLTGLKFDSLTVPFVINVQDSLGNKNSSEIYDVSFPSDEKQVVKAGPNRILTCCFGGVIFGIPAPTYVYLDKNSYFSLTKEIPFLSLYKSAYKYPIGFFSLEYAFIFHAALNNYFRVGYKHIFEVPYIEYISPGINGVTNFAGYNGLSPELTFGLFKFYEVFTVFLKYRYNFQPGFKKIDNFHEIGIGLYSNFFTFRWDL